MRVLVTGGGGFLGSALIASLPRETEAVSLDHGRHYDRLEAMLVGRFAKPPRWVRGGIDDPVAVREAMGGVDVLVHLAGVAGERRCTSDPLRSLMANVYGTKLLLDAAREFGVQRVVYASSYHAYSTFREREMPLREDAELGTDTTYGAHKALSERLVTDAGIPFAILRISALYGFGTGVGSQWEGLVGRWAVAAFAGRPIEVFGTGDQRIDMVFVDDVARAIQRLMSGPVDVLDQVYNVGGGEPARILDVARVVQRQMATEFGRSVQIEQREAPPGKVWPDKWLSVDKLARALGAFPFTPLDDGIRKSLHGFAPPP